jgi:hypothetical protein
MTVDPPVLLKPAEAAKLLRTTAANLAQDRFNRRGLPYLKIGARILYDQAVITEYLQACVVPPGAAPPGSIYQGRR